MSQKPKLIHYLSQNRPGPRMGMGLYEQHLLRSLLAESAKSNQEMVWKMTYSGRPTIAPAASPKDSPDALSNDFLGFSTERLAKLPWFFASNLVTLRLGLNADIFHSLSLNFPAPRNTPAIYTVHDLPSAHFSDELELAAWAREAANGARALLVPSDFARDEIEKILLLPSEKIFVIPNGCEHQRFNKDVEALRYEELCREGLPEQFLLYVGGATQRKNVAALLRAWDEVRRIYRQLHLVLVGPKEALACLLEKSGTQQVIVKGYVEREAMPRIMKTAKALVFPSIYEGFGLPPLEAMALGVPVIACRLGGAVPQVVGDAAALATDGSSACLAEQIIKVLSDEQLMESLRQAGPQRAKLFSWEKHARQVLDIYSRMLG